MRFAWLVTGAQGFVGRYVSAYILRTRPAESVLGIGRSTPLDGHFTHLISGPHGPLRAPLPNEILSSAADQDRYHYCRADVTSSRALQAIFEKFRPGRIVHLASGLRGDSRKDLLHINVEGTAALLEAIGNVRDYSPKLVMGSSGGVYGQASPERLPLCESLPCKPVDEYSVTKLAAERMARSRARELRISLVIGRIFNIVGAGQDERHVAGQIAMQLCRFRSGEGRALRLGSLGATRDFIDVRDVARALVALAEEEQAEGVFNIGTGVECAIGELLRHFLTAAGIEVAIEQTQEIQAGVPRNYADTKRLRGLGFAPAYSLRDSADAIWRYYEQLWAGQIPRAAPTAC